MGKQTGESRRAVPWQKGLHPALWCWGSASALLWFKVSSIALFFSLTRARMNNTNQKHPFTPHLSITASLYDLFERFWQEFSQTKMQCIVLNSGLCFMYEHYHKKLSLHTHYTNWELKEWTVTPCYLKLDVKNILLVGEGCNENCFCWQGTRD